MLRRTFAKTLLASCSLPFWPFPQLKEKISNSDLIKRLLKERKDFSFTTDDGMEFNVVRRKGSRISKQFQYGLEQRSKMTDEEKRTTDHPWQPRKNGLPECRGRWYKFKIPSKKE